ncbi:MAG TPA: PEGA domain-containing protein, partial [Acidimicrobiales bacterium]|nr:PEGA domain-containing protein [Acidimicrobiales bacterium]
MRSPRPLLAALAVLVAAGGLARAQLQPLPLPKGPRYSVKIDSSPQQAAIYVNGKEYGIQGYTPSTLKLPRGTYKFIVELPGFKPIESTVEITRSQAFTVALERAPRPAILDVRAGSDQSALGGTIVVDGTTVGTLPNQVEVAAGNHLVEVKKPGFNDDRESVQVAEGERRTLVVNLVAQSKPGDIIVMSDVPNADVWVDGSRRDTAPALIKDLPEGPHTVEVRKEGLAPWKQVVNVIGGQQAKVTAQLQPAAPAVPPPPAAGSLRILSATPMADVLVDGQPAGPVGGEIKGVAPGTHVVEVRAPGFAPQRVEVQVGPGETRALEVDLKPEAPAGAASLRVISAEPDVEVFLDGAAVGKAPLERNDLTPGRHYVVARKPGFP